jgi:hypothetical protein
MTLLALSSRSRLPTAQRHQRLPRRRHRWRQSVQRRPRLGSNRPSSPCPRYVLRAVATVRSQDTAQRLQISVFRRAREEQDLIYVAFLHYLCCDCSSDIPLVVVAVANH